MDAQVSELQAAAKEAKDAGINLYGAGVVYMKDEAAVDQTFEYAKNAGMSIIVGVPEHNLLNYVNKFSSRKLIKLVLKYEG